jgi:hypothetical protein
MHACLPAGLPACLPACLFFSLLHFRKDDYGGASPSTAFVPSLARVVCGRGGGGARACFGIEDWPERQ